MTEAFNLPVHNLQPPRQFASGVLELVRTHDFTQSPNGEMTFNLAQPESLIDNSNIPAEETIDVENARAIYNRLTKGNSLVPLMTYLSWDNTTHNYAVTWRDDGKALFISEVRNLPIDNKTVRPVNTMSFSTKPDQKVLKKVAQSHDIKRSGYADDFNRVTLLSVRPITDEFVLDAIAGKHSFDRPPAKLGFLGKLGLR